MTQAREALANYSVVGVGQRATDLLALVRVAGLAGALTCEGGPDVDELAAALATPWRTSESRGQRDVWTNESLGALVQDAAGVLPALPGRPVAVVLYAASRPWEVWGRDREGARIVAIDSAARRLRSTTRSATRVGLAARGIPVPEWVVASSQDLDFGALEGRLGRGRGPLVVQARTGSAGLGTHLAVNDRTLRALAAEQPAADWLVSAWAGQTTLNVHGLVTSLQVTAAAPSVQLVGLPELSRSATRYCGNDFGVIETVAAADVERAVALTTDVGAWLRDGGYRGIFGIDVAISGDDVVVLDVNPRMQGSTWLLSELEVDRGAVPTVVRHCLELLGGPVGEQSERELAAAAHLVVHWDGPDPLALGTRQGPVHTHSMGTACSTRIPRLAYWSARQQRCWCPRCRPASVRDSHPAPSSPGSRRGDRLPMLVTSA